MCVFVGVFSAFFCNGVISVLYRVKRQRLGCRWEKEWVFPFHETQSMTECRTIFNNRRSECLANSHRDLPINDKVMGVDVTEGVFFDSGVVIAETIYIQAFTLKFYNTCQSNTVCKDAVSAPTPFSQRPLTVRMFSLLWTAEIRP